MVYIKVKQKRKKFNFIKSVREIEQYIDKLPDDGEVYKFITSGKFSSISFIKFIADRTQINEMHVSSFRIGKKELQIVDALNKSGSVVNCHFAVGTLMENDSKAIKKYGYYDRLTSVCENNGWEVISINNHSKVLLFDTRDGKYVIETSSNLNENPKIEQFSFEKSDELYEFYLQAFTDWRGGRDGESEAHKMDRARWTSDCGGVGEGRTDE